MINSRICPHCGVYALRKMGIKNGYQQYKCTACKKCSSDSPEASLAGRKPCKHCDSLHTRKIGFTKDGIYQRYKCNGCGKYFSDSPIPRGSLPKAKRIQEINTQEKQS